MADLIMAFVALIAGISTGFTNPQSGFLVFVAVTFLVYLNIVLEGHTSQRLIAGLESVIAYAFILLAGTVVGGIVGAIARNPIVLLYAFWLYAFVATGYLTSRCCVGWHVGASGAVLLSFLAVGMLIQSFFNGNAVWFVLFIVAAGMLWGADDWRRANGLAINE